MKKKGLVGCSPVAPYIMYIYGELQRRASPACEGYCCQYRVFCLINDFAVTAGHTKGKVQHLAVVPLEAQLLLKALTEEVSEAGEKKKTSASGSIREEGIRVDTYEPRRSSRQLHRHRPGSKEGCRVLGRRNPERAPGSWLGWQRPWRRRRGW